MTVKLANRPSSRPGFTYVAEARARVEGPVVVVVSDYRGSVVALRRAAEEAAMLSVNLHVLDATPSGHLQDPGPGCFPAAGARDRAVALSILRNPHVSISRVDSVMEHCRAVGASLLVVDPQWFAGVSEWAKLLGRGVDGPSRTCDVLIVGDRPVS